MDYKNLIIFDADQYPLNNHLTDDDLQNSYIIAASNDINKITYKGRCYGEQVPYLPESADSFLVGMLFHFLQENSVDTIIIATRDKKLLQMLLCLITEKSEAVVVLHACCRDNIFFDLSEFRHVFQRKAKQLSQIERDIINHISCYNNGLKIKTLSSHYGISTERMHNIISNLEKGKHVENYINAYVSHGH